ncbi:MAG: ankyrin repeat domain-containing protein [Planctomycetaceae bacterium]|nr:ankyrin repeat domain-containing protein [Planctomycetaceae bacterium]
MTKRSLYFTAAIVGVSLFCASLTFAQTARVPESIYKEGYAAIAKLFSQAVVAGDFEVCKELLEKNAFYVNEADANGLTQLHYAAMSGQANLCRLLLQHGARADIARMGMTEIYFTPLEAAIANDHTEAALVLIEAVAPEALQPIRGRNRAPLFLAIMNENVEIIKALIAKKADVNTPGMVNIHERLGGFIQTPFAYAIAVGNKEIAKILLDAGADIRFEQRNTHTNTRTSDALFYAVWSRNYDLCKFLIESKFDVNLRGMCMFMSLDNPEEYERQTVLHLLLGESHLCTMFLKKDPFFDLPQPFAATGPYRAPVIQFDDDRVEWKSTASLVKLFIDAGADVNARDISGSSVLETLLIGQVGLWEDRKFEIFQELLELLIASKVDLNAADDNGWTPLYYLLFYAFLDQQEDEEGLTEMEIMAIAEKKIGLFKMLIDAGAKVKVADKKGNTLLHYVVRCPGGEIEKYPRSLYLNYETRGNRRFFSRQLVELLIENGASLSDENNTGETPLDWATQGGATSGTAPRSGGGFGGGGMGGYGGALGF